MLPLREGVMLGLWSRKTVEPAASVPAGAGEVAFTVENTAAVEATFADWKQRGLNILQEPVQMDFGTTFVATGRASTLALAASLPVGALATAVLVVNNVRDGATDVRTGKRTLVVRFGRAFGIHEYRVLLALALLVPVALVVQGSLPRAALIGLATLPRMLRLAFAIERETEGVRLNQVLADTAALLVVHAGLTAAGIAIESG